jgi:hypothetical protein
MGTGSLSWGQSGRGVALTIQPHLAPGLNEDYPSVTAWNLHLACRKTQKGMLQFLRFQQWCCWELRSGIWRWVRRLLDPDVSSYQWGRQVLDTKRREPITHWRNVISYRNGYFALMFWMFHVVIALLNSWGRAVYLSTQAHSNLCCEFTEHVLWWCFTAFHVKNTTIRTLRKHRLMVHKRFSQRDRIWLQVGFSMCHKFGLGRKRFSNTVEPGYNDIGLYDTSPIASHICGTN